MGSERFDVNTSMQIPPWFVLTFVLIFFPSGTPVTVTWTAPSADMDGSR